MERGSNNGYEKMLESLHLEKSSLAPNSVCVLFLSVCMLNVPVFSRVCNHTSADSFKFLSLQLPEVG